MPLNLRSRIVRLFSAAVVDQALLSAANFAVGIILVRFTTDEDYALFVMLQAILVLVNTMHAAAVCSPLSILAPKNPPEPKRQMIGAIWHSQNRLRWPMLILGVAICVVGELTGLRKGHLALVIGIGVMAGWWTVERSYVRNALIIYAKPRTLLTVDGVFVALLVGGALWAAFGFGIAAVWVAVAFALSAWISSWVGSHTFAKEIGWPRGKAAPIWRQLRSLTFWSITGSFIYWLFSRSYIYILATRLDLKAVADVNAVRLLVVPALLLTIGLQSVLTPISAAWHAEVGLDRLLRRLGGIIVVVGAFEVAYLAVMWLCRDWITSTILHKHIGDLDVLLMLWILTTLVSLFREVLVTALYAFGNLQWLAWQIGVCAVVSLAVAWFGIPWWGAAATLIALILGEILQLAGILYVIQRTRMRIRLQGATA